MSTPSTTSAERRRRLVGHVLDAVTGVEPGDGEGTARAAKIALLPVLEVVFSHHASDVAVSYYWLTAHLVEELAAARGEDIHTTVARLRERYSWHVPPPM